MVNLEYFSFSTRRANPQYAVILIVSIFIAFHFVPLPVSHTPTIIWHSFIKRYSNLPAVRAVHGDCETVYLLSGNWGGQEIPLMNLELSRGVGIELVPWLYTQHPLQDLSLTWLYLNFNSGTLEVAPRGGPFKHINLLWYCWSRSRTVVASMAQGNTRVFPVRYHVTSDYYLNRWWPSLVM